jgi:SH3-like domain-containing protein
VRRRFGCALLFSGFALALATASLAADSGLPLPRFVTLKSDQVNLRAGPGDRYPIEWVLTRKDMPVEIVAEFEHWRKVRDVEGTEGWVHQRMLAGRRSVLVKGEVRPLLRRPEAGAEVVARAEPGVIARLQECKGSWCRVEAQSVTGWVRRSDVWGVYPDEAVQ